MSTIDRPQPTTLPPLVAGQKLDRVTFHERYEAMPPGTRAELIGGIVYMPSPASYRHGKGCSGANTWIGLYSFRTPGVEALDNASALLDDEGEPQPDGALRIKPEFGGQTRNEGKYMAGPPELIVEVAVATRAVDLGAKRADYERVGVREYVVVAFDPDDVFWHALRDGQLVRVSPGDDGLYRSETFPGLWLDPKALLGDDGPALIAALERGLATPEHAAFVAGLAARRAETKP